VWSEEFMRLLMGLLVGRGVYWLLSVIDKTEGVGHACLEAGMLHLDTAGERVGRIYAQLHGLSYVIRPMCLIRDVWSNKRNILIAPCVSLVVHS
jgi:hypothetical protein